MTIRNSPWGKPQHIKELAKGITLVSTASHGGFRLSSSRMKIIEEKFPTFTPWAGACWLEEDCDVAFAVVAFPELWTKEEVVTAVNAMERIYNGEHLEEMKASCQDAIEIMESFTNT